MAAGNLESGEGNTLESNQYKAPMLDRLLGLLTFLLMLVLLVWEGSDIEKMIEHFKQLELIFRSRPLIMSFVTLCGAVAVAIPVVYVLGFVKIEAFRKTVSGTLEHVEKVQIRNGKRLLILIISGATYKTVYDEDLWRFISERCLGGRRVRVEIGGGAKNIFNVSRLEPENPRTRPLME